MAEKPILFNTEMVQAILDGRKTVTRRVVKPKYSDSIFEMYNDMLCEIEPPTPPEQLGNGMTRRKVRRFVPCKPRYNVGDIMWVRETWQQYQSKYYYLSDSSCGGKYGECPQNIEKHITCELCNYYEGWIKWIPSIHMPRLAARIFLKITDIRVERLQDIKDTIKPKILDGGYKAWDISGILAEGVQPFLTIDALPEFTKLWNSTIKPQDIDKYCWSANPWVWVIEFERVEHNAKMCDML